MKKLGVVITILLSTTAYAQNQLEEKKNNQNHTPIEEDVKQASEKGSFAQALSRLNLKAYGVVNYYNFDWQTDPDRRNAVDLERLNMYMYYKFSDKINLKAELEYEHGGTGVTMELDKFEEFGEFEVEVEAGGEVLLEQLNVQFNIKPWLNVRAGRLKLYMGVASKMDLPVDYFTGYKQEMENAILPLGWYEIGLEVAGDLGAQKKWSYKAYLVNGLSSVGFTSANWIKRGHQKRFEMAYAVNNKGVLTAKGKLDVLDFNTSNAFEQFGKLCTVAFHQGKTWSEVGLQFSVAVN